MKVVMVGSGNAAVVLGKLIHKSGHQIVQVVSRHIENAHALAIQYNADSILLTEPQFATADIYIVALHDAALEHVEKIKGLKNKWVVHTAGSVSIDILKNISSTYGVLYPLQSLSRAADHIPEIPFLVDGNTKEIAHKIIQFARSLSDNVIAAGDSERLHYHIAAVFAGNFTNHLFAISEDFCEKEKIEFKNLLPLIKEITSRVDNSSPRDVQTGPAIREDIFTVNRHLQSLSTHPQLKYLYLKLSESIIKLHEKRL
ncbi:MAG: Rossmann-like and DUF2520 domain-containing protein [Ginsengibacter sp.]